MSDDPREGRTTTRTEMLGRIAPADPRARTTMLVSCGVLVGLVAVFMALCAGLNVLVPLLIVPGWTVASGALAVGLAIPHVLIILWLDRNEQEPWWLLTTAWGWGAIMATGMSLIANTTFGLVAMGAVSDPGLAGQLTASFSAPPAEEITKGVALALIYLFFRKDFDNVLDGIIYGALVGVGFAMFENFIYYTTPFIEGRETAASDWVELVLLRGILTGMGTHWCFTALTGAGFGLFRVMRTGYLRWLMPVGGLILAIFAHFSWNTFTGLFVIDPDDKLLTYIVSIPLAVLVLQLPFVLLVGGVVALSWWHENVLIRRYLGEERRSVVLDGEIERLVPARRRLAHALVLLSRGQVGEWLRIRRRNRLLIQLAFERWHMDKEDLAGSDIEAGVHARRVTELRGRIRATV